MRGKKIGFKSMFIAPLTTEKHCKCIVKTRAIEITMVRADLIWIGVGCFRAVPKVTLRVFMLVTVATFQLYKCS